MPLNKYKEKYKDDRFYNEVFVDEIYGAIKDRKKKVVVDVGALGGEFSIWVYPEADVIYAIEPENDAYNELEENIKDFPKIKSFKVALGGKNGNSRLRIRERGGHQLDASGGQKVVVKTLATFMNENKIDHIDVLKIDIENAEQEVFMADDFKKVAKKLDTIIGEHFSGLGQLLEDYGFKMSIDKDNYLFTR